MGKSHLGAAACGAVGGFVLGLVVAAMMVDNPANRNAENKRLEVERSVEEMLALAQGMESLHEQQIWKMAVRMASKGYVFDSGERIRMNILDLHKATVGGVHLRERTPTESSDIQWRLDRHQGMSFLRVQGKHCANVVPLLHLATARWQVESLTNPGGLPPAVALPGMHLLGYAADLAQEDAKDRIEGDREGG